MDADGTLEDALAALDAIDLAYVITACHLPGMHRTWGQKAQEAEQAALAAVSVLVGLRPGLVASDYEDVARKAWARNGYTFAEVLR